MAPSPLISDSKSRWKKSRLSGFSVFTLLLLALVAFTWAAFDYRSVKQYFNPIYEPAGTIQQGLGGKPLDISRLGGHGGTRVIAVVFYGRREYVRILDCYLKVNLKENGGLLDEVIFVVNTETPEDLDYLHELIPTQKQYRTFIPDATLRQSKQDFSHLWAAVTEKDAIYVKIDDDTVYIENTTISSIVRRLTESEKYFLVSANVVNSPALSWRHYSMGLYEPFWPELEPGPDSNSGSWRPSTLPSYQGPPSGPEGFSQDGSSPAPFRGHRWLPVRSTQDGHPYNLSLTPAGTLTYSVNGPGMFNWGAAAQAHYSLLTHLEREEVAQRYRFDLWGDFSSYTRLNINLIAVRGSDILDAYPFGTSDDEFYLTVTRPRELGRSVVVDGGGVAAHFAFHAQYSAHKRQAITWTDAVDRYRGYAEEFVCHLVPFHCFETGFDLDGLTELEISKEHPP